MMRIQPKFLLRMGLSLAIVVGAAIHFLQQNLLTAAGQILCVGAYIVALKICLRIRQDYRPQTTMRLAWGLMAASSAMAMVRHTYEVLMLVNGFGAAHVNDILSLRQIPIVLSLLLLSFGLAAMWSSYATVGLGLRFRLSDFLIAIALVPAVAWVWALRESMSDAHSVYPVIRSFQNASPILLAVPALLGLVLHRISQEMGRGQLSRSLSLLVAFLLFRMGGLMVGVSPSKSLYAGALGTAMFHGAAWLFAMAVFDRLQMTVSAEQLTLRYDADPAAEIRQLSRSLDPTATLSQ